MKLKHFSTLLTPMFGVIVAFLASFAALNNAINLRLVNHCWPPRTLRVHYFSAPDGPSAGLTLGPDTYTNVSFAEATSGVIWADAMTSSDQCTVRRSTRIEIIPLAAHHGHVTYWGYVDDAERTCPCRYNPKRLQVSASQRPSLMGQAASIP